MWSVRSWWDEMRTCWAESSGGWHQTDSDIVTAPAHHRSRSRSGGQNKNKGPSTKDSANCFEESGSLKVLWIAFWKCPACKISIVFVVMCWQPPRRRITGFCLWHCQVSTLDGSVSCCWLLGVRKAKTKHTNKRIKVCFPICDLKSHHFREMFRKKPTSYIRRIQTRYFSLLTIEHTNPEIWLTRRNVPGIFWADSRENGHVSDEWFHYWNELDWSRGSIVTPILRAHFPDHQSTRHKMSKISNVLHTPHYLQSCWTATHSTLTLKRGHQDGFIIYLILRIISIITEEADKCLATREALGNSPNCLAFSGPGYPCGDLLIWGHVFAFVSF